MVEKISAVKEMRKSENKASLGLFFKQLGSDTRKTSHDHDLIDSDELENTITI
jgi:hypothetical protein